MGNYKKIVGVCPECNGKTMFDLRAEIVCQKCGLILHRPGNSQIAVCIGNNTPLLYEKENFKIPHNMHISSVVERVGLAMIELKWDRADLF